MGTSASRRCSWSGGVRWRTARRPGGPRPARAAPWADERLRDRGFTIVELIVVVILLGILSITAISRFVRPTAFAPGIVIHALVAEVRFAQQIATARSDATVGMTIDRDGADWRFTIATDVDGIVRTERVGAQNTLLQATSGLAGGTLGPGTSLVLEFARGGDLAGVSVGGTPGDPAAGVALDLLGDSNRRACIYPTGYAADAPCA